ncbi:MAG: hypothetical protein WCA56_07320 [Xanthobacteraceae bacterium]
MSRQTRSASPEQLYTLGVAVVALIATIVIGWLNLRTNERGMQALNDVTYANANDPIPKDATLIPFKGATMNVEVHNTGNVSFVLSDVRLFVKRSPLTKVLGHFADKHETCRYHDLLDTVDTLLDVQNGDAAFRPVSVPKGEAITLMLSFSKSADLPRTSKIASIITPRIPQTAVEGLLCSEFVYSSYDGTVHSVLQPLFLGRFDYDAKTDTLFYERGPPFVITRQTQPIF